MQGLSIRFSSLPATVQWQGLDEQFPTDAHSWSDAITLEGVGATHFGYVANGPSVLSCAAGTFTLQTGMYFSVVDRMSLTGGRGVVATRRQQQGLFSLGGPIERTGRLKYIDGCSDTLLLNPPRLGDACFNLLVLPPNTRQRMHDHPSVRVGVVADGHGRCLTPEGETALAPGTVFSIPAGTRHCFHTDESAMRVLAYHPDSDFGPQDDDHPMKNKTENLARAADASETVASSALVSTEVRS